MRQRTCMVHPPISICMYSIPRERPPVSPCVHRLHRLHLTSPLSPSPAPSVQSGHRVQVVSQYHSPGERPPVSHCVHRHVSIISIVSICPSLPIPIHRALPHSPRTDSAVSHQPSHARDAQTSRPLQPKYIYWQCIISYLYFF